MKQRLGDLKKLAKITLTIVLLVSAFLVYKASQVEFDYDFEAFFSKTDDETEFFEEHRRRFETDNDFIFIALRNDPTIFDKDFLTRTRKFVDELKTDTLVEEVVSLTHLEEYIKAPFSAAMMSRPYLRIDKPSKYQKDSVRISKHPEARVFLSKDQTSLLINVKHRQFLSKEKCDVLKKTIDRLLAKYEFDDFKYAGRTIGLGYYVDKMVFETGLFIGLSFALVIVFLLLAFKSFWGLWIPLIMVGFSMLWIIGVMGVAGEPINLILTILPSIIFVVAMSDVMHLVSKFLEELRNGKSKEDAVKIAYREVGKATLLTSLTTAVGFLTLLFVDMQPVQSFGIFTALGVILAFILAYTLLPSLLILVKAPKVAKKKNTDTLWYKVLHASFIYMLKRRVALFFGFLALMGLSIFGSSLVINDYFLLEDLKKSNVMRQDYQFFDENFMGLRPFELAIKVEDDSKLITDYDVLTEINKVDEFVTENYELNESFSIIKILKIANRTEHGGQLKYYKFPTEKETEDYLTRLEKFDKKGQLSVIIDSTKKHGRISSSIGDVGMIKVKKMNENFKTFIAENINSDLVSFRLTGTAHLLDRNMSNLSMNLFWGLGLAVIIVSLLMGLLFRSLKMVIIALIPNILPLVMLGAILGFSGVELKVSTALVFTISFGIAVDDTIHFMSKLKLELNKGKPLMVAMKRTFLSTGRAIVLTTLILIAGFLMLMFSDFLGTFYVGLLISSTLLFALISDLFFLPVLVIFFFKPKKKLTSNKK